MLKFGHVSKNSRSARALSWAGLLPALAILACANAFAGARLIFDAASATMTIQAKLVYFTADRVIPYAEADAITSQIARLWSGLPVRPGDDEEILLWVPSATRGYDVRVELESVAGLTLEQAHQMALLTKDPSVVFVRIAEGGSESERRKHRHQSRTTELTGNTVVLYDDDLDNFTSPAHEFGHVLGLDHRQQNVVGLPSIMAERGAFVEPRYRYNPSDPYSTINPIYRRVTFFDVRDFEFDRFLPPSGSGEVVYGVAYANVWKGPGRKYYAKVFSTEARP